MIGKPDELVFNGVCSGVTSREGSVPVGLPVEGERKESEVGKEVHISSDLLCDSVIPCWLASLPSTS